MIEYTPKQLADAEAFQKANPAKEGGFLSDVSKAGNIIATLPFTIPQAIMKNTASLGIDLYNKANKIFGGGQSNLTEVNVDDSKSLSRMYDILYGVNELFSGEPRTIKSTGQRVLDVEGGNIPFTDKKIGTGLAVTGIVGSLGLDLFPEFKGANAVSKNLYSRLVTSGKVDEVKDILNTYGIKVGDNIGKNTLEAISKTKSASEIRAALNSEFKLGNLNIDEFLKKSQAPDGKTAQVFNTSKLGDIPQSSLKQIEEMRSALGLEFRSVRTFDDIAKAASDLGTEPSKLLREVSQSRITGEEVVALRDLINTKSTELVDLERRIGFMKNADDIQATQIRINNLENELNTAISKVTKGGTEAGRAVAAYRIIARNTLEPSYWLSKAMRVAGRDLKGVERGAINSMIANKQVDELASFVSMLRTPSTAEKAITLWKAGLLTSPTTHAANIMGNLSMAVLESASDVVAAPFDILASLATGKRTVTASPSAISAKVKTVAKPSTFKEAGKFVKTGVYPENVLTKYDIPRNVNFGEGFGGKVINSYVNTIFRSLGAEDIVFRKMAIAESFEQSARVIAKNEGLTGEAFKSRVRDLILQPNNAMQSAAIDAAEYATFQNSNKLADGFSRLKRDVPALELIAPFSRTPANIAFAVASYSPAGFVKAIAKAALNWGDSTKLQKDFVKDFSRAVTGTGVMAMGALLAQKGLMTGAAPTDFNERADFYAEGKQPHSVYVNGHWLRLDRLSPVGNLLALGADHEEYAKTKEALSLVGADIGGGIQTLTEQSFLQGVSRALNVINDPDRNASKFIDQTVAGVVPSFVGRTARTLEPTLKEPTGIKESVQARIPGATEPIPDRRDIFGEKVDAPGGRLTLFDPFSTTKQKTDPVLEEAKKLGVTIGMSDRYPQIYFQGDQATFKLSAAEYDGYQKVHGRLMKQLLSKVIEAPEYKSLDSQKKSIMFENVKDTVRKQVNDFMLGDILKRRFDVDPSVSNEVMKAVYVTLVNKEEFNGYSKSKQKTIMNNLVNKLNGALK